MPVWGIPVAGAESGWRNKRDRGCTGNAPQTNYNSVIRAKPGYLLLDNKPH